MDTLAAARAYVAAGLSVVPIRRDGSKAAAVAWKDHQARLPSDEELVRWFGGAEPLGIALLGGAISGCLETLDFDEQAEATFAAWSELVEAECPGLVSRLSVARTPRQPPGRHVRYRCPDDEIGGNAKLALAADGQVLVETRGEGGYAVAPGTPAGCHPSGGTWEHLSGPEIPPAISSEEREVLLRCARALDRKPDVLPRPVGADMRPGDDFERRASWAEVLEPAGWHCVRTSGGESFWRRPGKDGPGWSATTGKCRGKDGADLLRVFSANAQPFESGKAYGKFRAFALLRFGGDLSAAADHLAGEGYGVPRNGAQPSVNGHAANGKAAHPQSEKKPIVFPEPIPASLLKASEGQPWLWHGYLAPNSITLLSGLWKAGKTTLLAHLLRAFSTGGEFCGRQLSPARVLFVTEESENRWARRRDQLHLEDHLSFLIRPFPGRPDWATWSEFIRYLAELSGRHRPNLIAFDPLVNLWPVRDENDNAQVLSALLPLHQLVNGPGLLLSHHVRKGDGEEATASRGAGALTGFVDTIVELRRYSPGDRRDRRRVLTAYGRDDETPEELVVELTGEGYVSCGDRSATAVLDLLPILSGLLPIEPPGWTRNEVLEHWSEDRPRPRTENILAALNQGAEAGHWQRTGHGRKGSPWRFWRPTEADSFAFPPSYKSGNANESAEDPPNPFQD
jgi:hypothetical protein